MNEKSITASRHGMRLDPGRPGDHRVAEAGRHLGLREALGVGLEVEERRAGRPSAATVSSSTKLPSSASCSIRSRPLTGKWWPHCGQTRRCALQLVVAVVRPAAGTGVRVLLRRPVVERRPACARSRRRSCRWRTSAPSYRGRLRRRWACGAPSARRRPARGHACRRARTAAWRRSGCRCRRRAPRPSHPARRSGGSPPAEARARGRAGASRAGRRASRSSPSRPSACGSSARRPRSRHPPTRRGTATGRTARRRGHARPSARRCAARSPIVDERLVERLLDPASLAVGIERPQLHPRRQGRRRQLVGEIDDHAVERAGVRVPAACEQPWRSRVAGEVRRLDRDGGVRRTRGELACAPFRRREQRVADTATGSSGWT